MNADLNPRGRFAENLCKARKKADVTQDQLAKRCDLHRTEISLLERAGREPRLGTLLKLANSLGITVEDLTKGISWNSKRQRFEYKR